MNRCIFGPEDPLKLSLEKFTSLGLCSEVPLNPFNSLSLVPAFSFSFYLLVSAAILCPREEEQYVEELL